MKKLSTALLLVAMLMISTILIAVPLTRCEEEEDPVRPIYQGKSYTDPPGYDFGEFPCNAEWLTFEVVVIWHAPPKYDPPKWPLVTTNVVMTSSIAGTVFSPSSFQLNNKDKLSQPVSVSVPIGGLAPGTHYAWIKPVADNAPDNPMYFYFTKVPCPTKATVTFYVVGVGSDFTGTVLTVDGISYGVGDLPISFEWNIGSEHTFAYGSPLYVGDCKRYVWDSTSGLSTAQSGTITVPEGGGTVTAYYHTEYYLTVKTDPEGLVTIPGEGWYSEGTDVELTAPEVAGYIFVYWDVDGTPVEGNPITVTMDTCHTATAHYWPELEYKQFVTDSNFNVIERFDTVWTPKDQRKTMFKLASTNPGQFMLNIVIKNTWDVVIDKIVISFTIDPLFELKGADPIQVHTGYGKTGTRVYAELGPGIITPPNTPPDLAPKMITLYNIEPGMTLYITIHLEYGPAREYFPRETMLNWKELYPSNTFLCGFTAKVPGPFPFEITRETSTTIHDPIIVLGVED